MEKPHAHGKSLPRRGTKRDSPDNDESRILQASNMFKRHSKNTYGPEGTLTLKSWLDFRKTILMEPKKLWESEKAFREEYMRHLKRKGPRSCRTSDSHARRAENNRSKVINMWWGWWQVCHSPNSPVEVRSTDDGKGLGVFLRDQKAFIEDIRAVLVGWLFDVKEEDFATLKRSSYPSLFQDGRMRSVLFGPLSLVNHECDSSLTWTKRVSAGQRKTMCAELNKQATVGFTKKKRRKWDWSAGSEVTVDYGRDYSFGDKCLCHKCQQKQKSE